VRLLLDTHAFLWAVGAPDRLTSGARDAITDPSSLVLVSAVTAWEVAIKRELGKLRFDGSVVAHAAANDFTPLPVTLAHAEGVADLAPHHADPFDRLLVSQAAAERATLVTRDRSLLAYSVPTLVA
jgi:PIN domain nuclease of toxin-antitoxin system